MRNKTVFKKGYIFLLLLVQVIGCDQVTTVPVNNNPVITSLTAFPSSVQPSDSFVVICSAYEPDGDSLFYDWFCTSGKISGAPSFSPHLLYNTKENIRVFYAPDSLVVKIDSIKIVCSVRDGKGGVKEASTFVGIKDNIPKLQIIFKNISNFKLRNLLVADRLVGTLEIDSSSKFIQFENFQFDTGLPDENASAEVNGKVLTNHYRGYWCGTEKIRVDSGKYFIEVQVKDSVLFLTCKNPPRIPRP
jgi:hypothetical protein